MSATALFDTTMALARRLGEATGLEVHIGSPLRREMGTSRLALTLLSIQPNAALRNSPTFRATPSGPVTGPAAPVAAVPFDLRFLVTCHRQPTAAGILPPEPGELLTLGRILRKLHAEPILTEPTLPGQEVRLSPASCSDEEMARIWGLFPEEPFRPSIVCLASPVFIEAG